ncbi:MAG: hypothetical protein RR607_08040 [Akkermansia sp.]
MFLKSNFSLPLLLMSMGAGVCLFSCGGGGSNQNTYLPIGTLVSMTMTGPATNTYSGTITLSVTGKDVGTVTYNSRNAFPEAADSGIGRGSNIPFYYWPETDSCTISINFKTANNFTILPGPVVVEYYTNIVFSGKIAFKSENNTNVENASMTYSLKVESGEPMVPSYNTNAGTGTATKSNSNNIGGN